MGVRFEADSDNAPDLPEAFRRDVRKAFSSSILYAGRYTPNAALACSMPGWPT
jgi:N-ethylmaleimide reductase